MKQLKRENIDQLQGERVTLPPKNVFDLPERIIQFGTGVLLRGLPDYFVDKANRQGVFNGRIVVVKSTNTGGADAFATQDGLYTLCVRGIEGGDKQEENIINSSISRVLTAATEWQQILACSRDARMQVVFSNTTESGIVPTLDNILDGSVPSSFPGKLLAFLYERFNAFNGNAESGMVIVPTELIMDNADSLKKILNDLAIHNQLGDRFVRWLNDKNSFCNSLVDRIVPGKLPSHELEEMQRKLGYADDLMIMTESFRLWAIESSEQRVKEILSFATVDNGVVITDNIGKFRELKLRLLNGTHTFACGLAFLGGFDTVREAMLEESMSAWTRRLMILEIAELVQGEGLTYNEACAFANTVLDRFRNPFLEHKWTSIAVNFTSKMRLRNIPLLGRLADRKSLVPEHMALGFAAYLLFMKCELSPDGQYRGKREGKEYEVQDEQAAWFSSMWQNKDAGLFVSEVLSDRQRWGVDLTQLGGFTDLVTNYVLLIQQHGALEVIRNRHLNKMNV